MLPDGWQNRTVGDICHFQNGTGFGPEDWDDHGLPIIRIQNLNGGTNFDYYSGTPDERWLVQPGQLLFAWAGTRGVSFGPTVWRGPTGVLNQHIFKVTAKVGVDPDWLFWSLRHVTNRIENSAHGFKATLLHVKKSDIDQHPIAVPPISEQRGIARALAVWAAAITATERLVANSLKQKDLLAQNLLSGRVRLGNYASWEKKTVSALIQESRLPGTNGSEARKLTVKLYGKGVTANSNKLPGSESTQYYRRTAGQFIYSKLDFLNGAFGLVPKELDGYESTLDLPAFDFLPEVEPRWFLHFVSREAFYRGHLRLANGGRKARRVNPTDLLRVAIQVPTLKEQKAIADAIDLAEKTLRSTESKRDLLHREKAALMQQLLTGRHRLKLSIPKRTSDQ